MRPGHYGVAGTPGVIAQRREGLAVVTIVTRKDAGSRLAADMQSAFGITPPLTPHAVTSGGITVVGIGPGRMLAVADVPHDFAQSLGAHAAVTEQSDANVVFDLSGPKVRMTLAKCLAIDLDPAAFKPGDAATTSSAYIGVTLWQIDAVPTYRFLIARSFAVAFTRLIADSAAEYAFDLRDGTGQT
jgi:heterotetrameric sarcosine oxidase gamma subunit